MGVVVDPMRQHFVIAMAVLVATALAGGAAGAAAGAQPGIEHANAQQPGIGQTDGPGLHQTDDAAACEFPIEVTDATGTTITLDEPPERITTTNPSAAQTLWELGAQDRVVGLTEYALYLDGADEKTDVSAEGLGVSVERVVNTDPDLVLAPNASADQVEDLREQGLTVYHFSEATSVDDIAEKTEITGQIVGECEAAADTNAEMADAVAAAEERTADVDRPAALYPLGDGFVAAGGTFIDEIMTVGGVDNVAAAEHEGYPQLSNEVILEADPEVLIVTDPEAPILDEEPYASTTAGTEGNYVVLDVNYLNQPAPRSVIESVETLSVAVEELQASEEGAGDEATDGEDADGGEETGDEEEPADGEDADDGDETTEDGADTGAEAPGFGVVAAAIALLATGLLARRD